MFSLVGIFALFIVYLVRFLFIFIEKIDYSSEKYKVNIYRIDSLSSRDVYKGLIMGFFVALVTLLLGALAGAVASVTYSAPNGDELSNLSSAWDWFLDSTRDSLGSVLLLFIIIIIFEFLFIIFYAIQRNSKNDTAMLDQIYGSFQIGELSKNGLGEPYKKELLKSLPEIFRKHLLVKEYANLNRVNIWGLRKLFRKKLISRISFWCFCVRLSFSLFLFCDIFLISCRLLSVNRDNFESFLLLLCLNVFIFVFVYLILFTRMIVLFELGILRWRMNNLRESYLIIKGKRDYIENLLKKEYSHGYIPNYGNSRFCSRFLHHVCGDDSNHDSHPC